MAGKRVKAAHIPDEESRKRVRALARYGTPEESIAIIVGCKVEELRRGYEDDLARAEIEATAIVADALYKKALSGDTQAQIFFLRSRGWKDR